MSFPHTHSFDRFAKMKCTCVLVDEKNKKNVRRENKTTQNNEEERSNKTMNASIAALSASERQRIGQEYCDEMSRRFEHAAVVAADAFQTFVDKIHEDLGDTLDDQIDRLRPHINPWHSKYHSILWGPDPDPRNQRPKRKLSIHEACALMVLAQKFKNGGLSSTVQQRMTAIADGIFPEWCTIDAPVLEDTKPHADTEDNKEQSCDDNDEMFRRVVRAGETAKDFTVLESLVDVLNTRRILGSEGEHALAQRVHAQLCRDAGISGSMADGLVICYPVLHRDCPHMCETCSVTCWFRGKTIKTTFVETAAEKFGMEDDYPWELQEVTVTDHAGDSEKAYTVEFLPVHLRVPTTMRLVEYVDGEEQERNVQLGAETTRLIMAMPKLIQFAKQEQ